jgi:hypothetical protein
VSRKGQGTIGVIALFAIAMITTVFLFIFMNAGGGMFQKEVEPAIEMELGEVKTRSTVTAAMNDYLWRNGEIEPEKYDNKLAIDVLSLYFTTEGDTIYIGENDIPKDEVKNDIKKHFKSRMDKYWIEGPSPVDYWLSLSYEAGGSEQDIVVKSYEPSAEGRSLYFPVALPNGEAAFATIWLEEGEGVYAVNAPEGRLGP